MLLTGLIPALPLAGATVLLLSGKRWKDASAGWLASALVAGSFVVSAIVFFRLLALPAAQRISVGHFFDWIASGTFHVNVDLRADPLSIVMALTVTGVATLIHLYSIEYMHADPRFARFFGYMNLFVFFMLMLVLANNFFLLYLGWEGVGLCSYLLIVAAIGAVVHGRRKVEEEETIDVPGGDETNADVPTGYLPAATEAGP